MLKKKTIYRKLCIPLILLFIVEEILLYAGLDGYGVEDDLQRSYVDTFQARLYGYAAVP